MSVCPSCGERVTKRTSADVSVDAVTVSGTKRLMRVNVAVLCSTCVDALADDLRAHRGTLRQWFIERARNAQRIEQGSLW